MEISVFQNNQIERLRLENILLNKRILLCSVCRLADSLTAKYVEYLEFGYNDNYKTCMENIKKFNIDKLL